MASREQEDRPTKESISSAAAALRRLRGRPCFALVTESICRCSVLTMRQTLGDARGGAVDVLLHSNGATSMPRT